MANFYLLAVEGFFGATRSATLCLGLDAPFKQPSIGFL